jgi:hypothetical protein
MLMAPDVLDLMEAMRCAYDHAVQVLRPANEWERDRLASKIVELVQAGERSAAALPCCDRRDAARVCHRRPRRLIHCKFLLPCRFPLPRKGHGKPQTLGGLI